MVRQDGTISVHWDSGGGSACYRGRLVTDDPLEVTCGRCLRRRECIDAYNEARKVAKR